MDTETSGFLKDGGENEPIQIVALLYKNGLDMSNNVYTGYFLPKGNITKDAFKTHGMSLDSLKERRATEFTNGKSRVLANFLNREKDFPIIAHNVRYDRDQVLKPAFKKVGNLEGMPSDDRWVCTIKLADKRTDLVPHYVNKGLDSLLSHFKFERRDPNRVHDAFIDCIKTAQLYEKLMEPRAGCPSDAQTETQ